MQSLAPQITDECTENAGVPASWKALDRAFFSRPGADHILTSWMDAVENEMSEAVDDAVTDGVDSPTAEYIAWVKDWLRNELVRHAYHLALVERLPAPDVYVGVGYDGRIEVGFTYPRIIGRASYFFDHHGKRVNLVQVNGKLESTSQWL